MGNKPTIQKLPFGAQLIAPKLVRLDLRVFYTHILPHGDLGILILHEATSETLGGIDVDLTFVGWKVSEGKAWREGVKRFAVATGYGFSPDMLSRIRVGHHYPTIDRQVVVSLILEIAKTHRSNQLAVEKCVGDVAKHRIGLGVDNATAKISHR